MKILPRYGCDTGMYLVDVFLETAEELTLDDAGVWQALLPLLKIEKVDPIDVVDFFLHVKNEQDKWISVFRNSQGELIPIDRTTRAS